MGRVLAHTFVGWAAALALAGLLPAAARANGEAGLPAAACETVGRWSDPESGRVVAHERVIEAAARRNVVLLGEAHASAEHHRWQLTVIAALHGRRADMVLGLEMFPRRLQPVLDRWTRGELSAPEFLEGVDWWSTWGYEPGFYLPILHFARLYRVPMVALNVERRLVARVRKQGWDAIPEAERLGIGTPAAASEAYLRSLARDYLEHGAVAEPPRAGAEAGGPPGDRRIAETLQSPAFRRFVAAQLTWDRAMAEAIAAARRGAEPPLVVAIMGSGHLRHRFGVPHQLEALGVGEVRVLLPWSPGEPCTEPPAGIADAVFRLAPPAEPARPRPRLGVRIEGGDDAVRVVGVMQDSVAAAAGVREGDLIVEAGGLDITDTAILIRVVRRQLPGTWLPLTVVRAGTTLQLIARFPAENKETP